MRQTKKAPAEKSNSKEKKPPLARPAPSFNAQLDAILSPFWAPRMSAPDIHTKRQPEEANPPTVHR